MAGKAYIPGPQGGITRLMAGNGDTSDTIAVSANPLPDLDLRRRFRNFTVPVSTKQQTIGTNASGQPVSLGAQTAAELKSLFTSSVATVSSIDWAKWAGLLTVAFVAWVLWKKFA